MRCKNCGSEWTIAEHLHIAINACPFCGHKEHFPKCDVQTNVSGANSESFDIVGNILREYLGSSPDVYIPNGILETGTTIPGRGAFYDNQTIRKLVFPNTTNKIGAKACYNCKNLEEVIIPEGVTTIGEYAFFGCSSLKQINLPSSICSIEKNAFENSGLVSIRLPPNLREIEEYTFKDNVFLEKVTIPGTIKKIGWHAFCGCINLRTLDIQSGVQIISPYAFSGCTALTKVELPNGLIEIGYGSFNDCYYLTTVLIPESVQRITVDKPYYGPDTGPFKNCTALTNVTYPQRFGAYVFSGSLYYETARLAEEKQKELDLQAQKKLRTERLNSGKCPNCNIKLSIFGKCSKCGKRY